MTHRLCVERRNIQKLKEKLAAVPSIQKHGPKKVSQKVGKERFLKLAEAVFARMDPYLEQIDLPSASRDIEPEDEVLAARVEALYKQLGDVSSRVVRLREEVPILVEKVVTRELEEGAASATAPAAPAEVVVPAPLPPRLKDGVERNYAELINTLAKLERTYPNTLEKARRIKAVAEQKGSSKTDAVIEQELKATVASPRRSPASRKSPKRR